MTDAILLREDRGAVRHLTLNAPGSLNALSDGMLAALKAEFQELMDNTDQRVVVLRGAGRAFCAGHDLKEMQAKRQSPDGGAAGFRRAFRRLFRGDADAAAAAPARHCRGPWAGHRRRLPAGGQL